MTKTFKRGYFQYHIMEELNLRSMTSREIRRMAKELKHGKGTFDPIKDRGYYSSAFKGMNGRCYMTDMYGYGWIHDYCEHVDGKYSLRKSGFVERKLEKLRAEFKKQKVQLPTHYKVIKEYPGGHKKGTIITDSFIIFPQAKRYPEFFEPFTPERNFTFNIRQVMLGEITIKAKSRDEAYDKVIDLLREEKIKLDIDDYEINW